MTVWAACSDGAVRQYSYSEGQAGERLELTRQGQEVSSHCLQVVRLLGASLVTTNTDKSDIYYQTKLRQNTFLLPPGLTGPDWTVIYIFNFDISIHQGNRENDWQVQERKHKVSRM